jgi:hypothetical protein
VIDACTLERKLPQNNGISDFPSTFDRSVTAIMWSVVNSEWLNVGWVPDEVGDKEAGSVGRYRMGADQKKGHLRGGGEGRGGSCHIAITRVILALLFTPVDGQG